MPISFGLFTLGLAKLGHEIYTAGGVAETSVFLVLASFQMAALGLLADMIDKRL